MRISCSSGRGQRDCSTTASTPRRAYLPAWVNRRWNTSRLIPQLAITWTAGRIAASPREAGRWVKPPAVMNPGKTQNRTSGYSEGRSGVPVRSGRNHTPSAGASSLSSVAGSVPAGLNSTAIWYCPRYTYTPRCRCWYRWQRLGLNCLCNWQYSRI